MQFLWSWWRLIRTIRNHTNADMPNESYCSRVLRVMLLEIQLNEMSLFVASVRMPEPVRMKDDARSQSCCFWPKMPRYSFTRRFFWKRTHAGTLRQEAGKHFDSPTDNMISSSHHVHSQSAHLGLCIEWCSLLWWALKSSLRSGLWSASAQPMKLGRGSEGARRGRSSACVDSLACFIGYNSSTFCPAAAAAAAAALIRLFLLLLLCLKL